MAQAYIFLTDQQDGQYWALATGDGVQEEAVLLAVGRAFTADVQASVQVEPPLGRVW